MSSKLEIINNGLQGAGLRPVTAANSADKWQILSSQYQTTVDAELESGNYHFSAYRDALTGRVAGSYGFTDGWTLPNEAIFVRHVYINDILTDHNWTTHRGVLYLNATSGVSVEYLKVNDEGEWTAGFIRALTTYMTSVAWRSIWRNTGEADRAEQKSAGEFMLAGVASSRGRNSRDYQRTGRIKARRLSG